MEGFELGEGASYGKIISGLVSVGDGRPEGMWDVDDCMLRADFAKSSADGDPSGSRLTVRKRKSGVVLVKWATCVGE